MDETPRLRRHKVEAEENWRGVVVPPLRFPPDWEVTIIPPFGGAMVRFHLINAHGVKVSVYFDDRDALGYVGRPYWEIYSIGGDLTIADDDDTQRFLAGEEAQMIKVIARMGDPVNGAVFGLTGEHKDD